MRKNDHFLMKKHILQLTILLVLIILKAEGVYSSSPMNYHNITTFEGLPSNTVGAIKKDNYGFIWIGTKGGLCRFDGCEVKTYPLLSKDDIWSIEELDNDTLLLGTVSGLKYFSRKNNAIVKLNIPPAIVKSIQKTAERQFLVGTEAGLYFVNNHIPRHIFLETGLSSCNHITSIISEDNNIYWFSTADGLGKIDIRTMKPEIYRMPENISNSNFFICLTRVDNHIYLGSFNKGIFSFDMKKKKFAKVNKFEHNLIMTIDGHDNQLFVGTNGQGMKVLSLHDGSIEVISLKEKGRNSISSNTITAFLYDNGLRWIGTQFGGINYTPRIGTKFSYYSKNNFYSTDYRVRSFYMFPNGDKLIGTRTGLFFVREKTGEVKSYSLGNNHSCLRSDLVVFINCIQNKILIGTYGGGVHIFDEKKLSLKDFSQEELFLYGCIFNIVEDMNGNLWFASQSGLYQSTPDGHILKKYDTMNSVLTTNAILSLHVDSMNRLWIGSKFGLFILDIATGKMRADCFSIPIKNEIKYIMEDSQNDMWVCTNNGLFKIGKDLIVNNHFTTDNLLPDNQVSCIQEDSHGIYWIATQNEIVRYNPVEKHHYTYQRQDGLSGLEFNNSVFVSKDSIIWWMNEGGLIYTSTQNINAKRHFTNKPTITSYTISHNEYDYPFMDKSEGIVLPSSENNIHFKFSNMDYALPYANFYEYKLEGYDKEWLKQTGVNEVYYKDLPGGNYIFKLRVPGDENQMQTVNVYVRESYSFMAGVLFVIILISVLVIYFCYRIWMLKKYMTNERIILSTVQERSKDKKTALPKVKVSGILDNLLSLLEHEKLYLNPKLSIADVASRLHCTETELSQLLNNHMNVNFANFINVYRVNEIKKRLSQENLSKYTLKALSEQCGFSSKATFYRVFKNVTGQTPLEYCKKQNLVIKEN